MGSVDSSIGGENWMAVREAERGEDYVEALLNPEISPEGTRSDQIFRFTVAYSLLPENGRYSPAILQVKVRDLAESSEASRTVSSNSSKFSTIATVQKSGEWGHKINLYGYDNEKKVGSLQVKPSFDTLNRLSEGEKHPLIIELTYRHDHTKETSGFSEGRIQTAREESQECRENI